MAAKFWHQLLMVLVFQPFVAMSRPVKGDIGNGGNKVKQLLPSCNGSLIVEGTKGTLAKITLQAYRLYMLGYHDLAPVQ
ncbi:hypothetical protein GOBAR_DD26138 [Gossypium barbadense]|nr:hypothetical protein GOBAR_DD26138 [Gossypium barbadense]